MSLLSLAGVEAVRLWREPRMRHMALLAPLLLLIVFAAAWQEDARMNTERARFAAAERARWLGQGAKDPHSAAHFGVWAVKPPSPLAPLAPGVEPFVGLSVWLEAHKRNEMIFRPRQDADPIMRSATSVAQLIELLGPLFATLLGFAGFAQDRERGTLRTALGNGADAARLLLPRLCVMAGVLAAMLIVPAALAAAFTLTESAGWNGAQRLLLWCVLHYLYVLTFLLATLAVSLRAASARAALGTMLAAWVVLCVLLPRAAGSAVQVLAPLPSYQAVRAEAERAVPAYENADRWAARRQAFAGQHADASDQALRAAMLDQSERDSHAVFDRLLGSFYDAIERQDETFGYLGVFTPAVALQTGGNALAGTDFYHHRHFIDAAETYRRSMVNQLNGELMRHAQHGTGTVPGQTAWESVAPLDYRAAPLARAIVHAGVPLFMVLAWCLLAAGAAWHAALRVKP